MTGPISCGCLWQEVLETEGHFLSLSCLWMEYVHAGGLTQPVLRLRASVSDEMHGRQEKRVSLFRRSSRYTAGIYSDEQDQFIKEPSQNALRQHFRCVFVKTFSMTRNKLDSERPGRQELQMRACGPDHRGVPMLRLSGREKFLHRIHVSSTFREISFPYLKSRDSRWFCGQFLRPASLSGQEWTVQVKPPGGHFFFSGIMLPCQWG